MADLQPEAAPGPASLAAAIDSTAAPSSRGDVWRRFRRNRLAIIGLVILVLMVLAAILAPLITFYDPAKIDPPVSRRSPSGDHWFGTDLLGRDLYTRIVYGSRVSLRVGIFSVAIALAVGLTAGAAAGFYGRWIDSILMRLTDIFLAFPYILAAIAIITVLGRGEATVIAVLGGLGWMAFARIFRSSILSIKETEYIEAAPRHRGQQLSHYSPPHLSQCHSAGDRLRDDLRRYRGVV